MDGDSRFRPNADRIIFFLDPSGRCMASDDTGAILYANHALDTVKARAYELELPVMLNYQGVVLPYGDVIFLAEPKPRRFSRRPLESAPRRPR